MEEINFDYLKTSLCAIVFFIPLYDKDYLIPLLYAIVLLATLIGLFFF